MNINIKEISELENFLNEMNIQKKIKKLCCDNISLINCDNHYACENCGKVIKTIYEKELNFNKPMIYSKHKYMAKKLIKEIDKLNISFSEYDDLINKVIDLFERIGKITNELNLTKKYSLNYNFTIYKIFGLLKLDNSFIILTNNEKLIKKYNDIWNEIYLKL